MLRFSKNIIYLIIVFILNSCSVSIAYKCDYGKENKSFRYMDLKERQFTTSVSVSRNKNEIHLNGLSKYNAPTWIEDTISEVHFIKKEVSFPDGTVLEKKSRPYANFSGKCIDKDGKEIPCLEEYYTCDNFKKKLRKNRYMNLKLVYDVDSLGTVTHYEKEYELVKKRYYRIGLH